MVVDFWAAWCGPCRTLGPMLEEAVRERDGAVVLAKVDVDENQELSQRFGVRGIPAVMGFRDGEVAAQFTGAVPRARIASFLDTLIPSPADRLVARAREQEDPVRAASIYEEALRLEPEHRDAAIGLAQLVADEDPGRALTLVEPHRPHPTAEAVATRADLAAVASEDAEALRARLADLPNDAAAHLQLGRILAARQDYAGAIEHLLEAVRSNGQEREAARQQLVALFSLLGDDELVAEARRELAKALF